MSAVERTIVPSERRLTVSHDTALIVEGGAMRSVFSAGLLDGFLQEDFDPFDFYIGVSAGASNLAAFLAGTPLKTLDVYLNFALSKRFIDYGRFLRGGHLIDIDWLVATAISQGAFDVTAPFSRGKRLYVGLTDLASGEGYYVKVGPYNLSGVIKASMAMPVFYRGFPEVDGRPMTDGGVADGIPVGLAIRLGAKRIMVVRSRARSYRKRDSWVHRYVRWKMRGHAALLASMRERVERHEAVVDLIRHPPPGVSIVEVSPPEDFVLGRFSRDRAALLQGYQTGFEAAQDAMFRWRDSERSLSNPWGEGRNP